MSPPPASGRPRSSSRSRGNTRNNTRARDPRNGAGRGGRQPGVRQASNGAAGDAPKQFFKPPPRQNHSRNKSWRNTAHLSTAILDHAGKLPDSRKDPWRNPMIEDSGTYKKRMNDLYQTLKEGRERERKQAIKDGFLADPDKPTSLANAITPVGTCQDMCPEFERVERIVQIMVDGSEKETSESGARVPCEALMVKRFRRSAAGYDEQLPSDIRPPAVLKKSLDYLFEGVIGGPEPLATVHKFVWDRTRGIRNDFSIQQVTKTEDLKIAIDCFERIARFHILSLHQLSRNDAKDNEFDHHQEREQLNNTLLSLMYYYDDSRHKLASRNEPEFRAYCIIFEIQDQRPDLEDRAQNWPMSILEDQRVRTALKLYAAAANTSDEQGPLRPRTAFSTAQANTGGFWNLVRSNAVSYLMACVAEIYFNLVRSTALEAIWNAYKMKRGGSAKVEAWLLRDMTVALGFDNDDQAATFCEDHEFEVLENDNGEAYVDLGSIVGGHPRDTNPRRKQIFSRSLVERKRLGRTLPAVINGLSASQAQSQGLIEDSSDAETASVANSESLFVNGNSDEERSNSRSRSGSPQKTENTQNTAQFNSAVTASKPSWTFGQPSVKPNPFLSVPSGQPQSNPTSILDNRPNGEPKPNPFSVTRPPPSNLLPPPNNSKPWEAHSPSSPFGTTEPAKPNPFGSNISNPKDSEPKSASSPFAPQTLPSTGTFGRPSSPFPTNDAQKQPLDNSKQAPTFSWTTSPLFPTAKQEGTNGGKAHGTESGISNLTPAAMTTNASNVSLGSSSLFQPATTTSPVPTIQEPGPNQPESVLPHVPNQKSMSPFSFSPAPAEVPPSAIFTSNTLAPIPSATTFTSSSQDPPVLFQKLGAPSKPSTTGSFQSPRLATSSSDLPQSILPSFAKPISDPAVLRANLDAKIAQAKSQATASKVPSPYKELSTRAPNEQSSEHSIDKDSSLAYRSAALDKLAETIVLEEGGLLQQFVEFTIGPILRSSLVQFENERSWAKAKEIRLYLLAKKYARKWKANAWSMGLKRRGKERRRNLARSLQDSAKKARLSQSGVDSSPFSIPTFRPNSASLHREPNTSMPPPSTTSQKRQSLPAHLDYDSAQTQSETRNNKRKRDNSNIEPDHQPPRRSKPHHQRSNTLGAPKMSASPLRFSRTSYGSSIDNSKLGDGSLLNDTLMRQARRLAPNIRSDTTRTDYFKLKSLGIDPDTPTIPLTNKRARGISDVSNLSTRSAAPLGSPRASNTNPTTSHSPASTPSSNYNRATTATATPATAPADDDDEALFASIRAVRETLADSTAWFQSERESLERSMTPQTHCPSSSPAAVSTHKNHLNNNDTTKGSTSRQESPAELRLRELRERGHQPSRTELRLRAMGDKAILPPGFWDGRGMGTSLYGDGKGKGKEREGAGSFMGEDSPGGHKKKFEPFGESEGGSDRRIEERRGLTGRVNGVEVRGAAGVEDSGREVRVANVDPKEVEVIDFENEESGSEEEDQRGELIEVGDEDEGEGGSGDEDEEEEGDEDEEVSDDEEDGDVSGDYDGEFEDEDEDEDDDGDEDLEDGDGGGAGWNGDGAGAGGGIAGGMGTSVEDAIEL